MSSINHHGEFTLHALLYIARLIAGQRYDEVLQLGLRRDQADAIRSMTTEDLHEVSLSIRANFLDVRLDRDAFDAALAMLKRRKCDEDLDRALILAGVRYEMMHRFCGMTTEEYARHRRYLDLTHGRGRPLVPSEEVQAAVWQAWLDCGTETNPKRRYLAVHEKTQVPVGTIWKLIGEWESTGLTPVLPGPTKRSESDSPDGPSAKNE
ncbi:MAG: STY4526/YPO1902 family pathogenicity island replication protein [Blastocatellia bacterium]